METCSLVLCMMCFLNRFFRPLFSHSFNGQIVYDTCHIWSIGNSIFMPISLEDWGQEVKGVTEDEMVGWHHQLYGYEFEQTQGHRKRQGSLACCSPWGHKESERVGREVGGGIGMGKTCEPKAFSFQCMTELTTIKKKKRIRCDSNWTICLTVY